MSPPGSVRPSPSQLAPWVRQAISLGSDYAWQDQNDDGHWCHGLQSNVTMTAELMFFYQSLGIDPQALPFAKDFLEHFMKEQNPDGSWSLAPGMPGDVSVSSEAYLAMKLLGVPVKSPEMLRAQRFIREAGGVSKVRMLARIFFAQFGLLPWSALPNMPCEFVLLPSMLPINIYKLSFWARANIMALLLIFHHQPVYALPNGHSSANCFLDELWLDHENKNVPYGTSSIQNSDHGTDAVAYIFKAIDTGLSWLGGPGGLRWVPFLRNHARRTCLDWLLARQEPEGDWSGAGPGMFWVPQALLLEGIARDDERITRAFEAIERLLWDGGAGKQVQVTISPVWDTALTTIALCEAGEDLNSKRLVKATEWLKRRQILHPDRGDWRVFNPTLAPGGFAFQYFNTHYPDCDDTAVAVQALIRQNPGAAASQTVTRAVLWLCGMQNRDGGWAAYDTGNDALWLNKIPFSDMDALCDPSSPDVCASVLEAFGLLNATSLANKKAGLSGISCELSRRVNVACNNAIQYLANTQEANGSWYGRWGVNYIYGATRVLWALSYFAEGDMQVHDMVRAAVSWLKQIQNPDGGWGEDVQTYRDIALAGQGKSTPSQTAWAVMALLTTCEPDDESVMSGVSYLLCSQNDQHSIGKGVAWKEDRYTGTGFPIFFYLGYTGYRIYFPLMALGKYWSAVKGNGKIEE